MEYGQGIELSLPYPEAVRAVKAALKEQGFGVLTEIDVQGPPCGRRSTGTSRTTSSSRMSWSPAPNATSWPRSRTRPPACLSAAPSE